MCFYAYNWKNLKRNANFFLQPKPAKFSQKWPFGNTAHLLLMIALCFPELLELAVPGWPLAAGQVLGPSAILLDQAGVSQKIL